MGEAVQSKNRSRSAAVAVAVSAAAAAEVAAVSAAGVLVEVIMAEGLSGTHASCHLARFHLKIPLLELHLRVVQRVQSRVK